MKNLLAALSLAPLLLSASPRPAPAQTQTAVLAGGCFWGMEAVFEQLRGVSRVVAGYAGGSKDTAYYEAVETGRTGHAESVEISYDPRIISYRDLLRVFFTVAHDPTELNRQGPDVGPQYRSAIFYLDRAQKETALGSIAELVREKRFHAPIVTQVVPLRGFYAAESYHQHFVARNPDNPYVVTYDLPKLADVRAKFPQLVIGAK